MGIFGTKEVNYFSQFAIGAEYTLKAAKVMHEMFEKGKIDLAYVAKIKDIEHEADMHRHKMFEHLNKSFITPIDREDINVIVDETDNIVDSIDSVAKAIYAMRVESSDKYCLQMSELIIKACTQLVAMMNEMKNFKKPKKIIEYCIEINNIEESGDKLLSQAMHELFAPGADPLYVFKMTKIYKELEGALDNCEDVADIIQGIMTTKS